MKGVIGTAVKVVGVVFAAVVLVERFNLDDKVKMALLPVKFKMQDIAEETQQRVAASMMQE